MPVKIGIPAGFSGGLVREIENPAYSTAVGLVYYGLKYRTHDAPAKTVAAASRKERSLRGFAGKMKEWFDQL
jgi:cell division ATPase FtsA